jgi:hypothetical protein
LSSRFTALIPTNPNQSQRHFYNTILILDWWFAALSPLFYSAEGVSVCTAKTSLAHHSASCTHRWALRRWRLGCAQRRKCGDIASPRVPKVSGGISSPGCGVSGSTMGLCEWPVDCATSFLLVCGDSFCAGRGNCGTVARGGGVDLAYRNLERENSRTLTWK